MNIRIFTDKAVPTPYQSLLKVPEYRAAYSKWGDPDIALKQLQNVHVHQLDAEMVPWFNEWLGLGLTSVTRVELSGLLLGQKGHSDADILASLKKIADKWNTLKAEFK